MDVKGIDFVFGVGGEDKKFFKLDLKNFSYASEDRIWGKFYNLFTDERLKLKELVAFPGKGMSYQKHRHRDEIWFVSKGKCLVNYSGENPDQPKKIVLNHEENFHVKRIVGIKLLIHIIVHVILLKFNMEIKRVKMI